MSGKSAKFENGSREHILDLVQRPDVQEFLETQTFLSSETGDEPDGPTVYRIRGPGQCGCVQVEVRTDTFEEYIAPPKEVTADSPPPAGECKPVRSHDGLVVWEYEGKAHQGDPLKRLSRLQKRILLLADAHKSLPDRHAFKTYAAIHHEGFPTIQGGKSRIHKSDITREEILYYLFGFRHHLTSGRVRIQGHGRLGGLQPGCHVFNIARIGRKRYDASRQSMHKAVNRLLSRGLIEQVVGDTYNGWAAYNLSELGMIAVEQIKDGGMGQTDVFPTVAELRPEDLDGADVIEEREIGRQHRAITDRLYEQHRLAQAADSPNPFQGVSQEAGVPV